MFTYSLNFQGQNKQGGVHGYGMVLSHLRHIDYSDMSCYQASEAVAIQHPVVLPPEVCLPKGK